VELLALGLATDERRAWQGKVGARSEGAEWGEVASQALGQQLEDLL
jgi:hypothetical protein